MSPPSSPAPPRPTPFPARWCWPCSARALVEMADSGDGFAAFAARSRSRGANEWHVHLLAATPAERAMAMRDLRG